MPVFAELADFSPKRGEWAAIFFLGQDVLVFFEIVSSTSPVVRDYRNLSTKKPSGHRCRAPNHSEDKSDDVCAIGDISHVAGET